MTAYAMHLTEKLKCLILLSGRWFFYAFCSKDIASLWALFKTEFVNWIKVLLSTLQHKNRSYEKLSSYPVT